MIARTHRYLLLLALAVTAAGHARSQVEAPVPADAAQSAERPEWARTLQRISHGVVAVQVDLARSFDTEVNASLIATGFVVDATRGLILTNRHVVTPGPVTAQGIFLDREEVQLYPVYRDPVHDFGFYRYDPAKLRFIAPQQIPLFPAGAQVGTEIRVVGNDAGEQLSFLAGTLARLDRQAPSYGVGKYNDFDTFYYQAASSTSGGSSGSPVIDVRGRAVALNAGAATAAASSYYLPLDRVVRALGYIERGEPVPRGTLQTVFNYTPYDELRRLGLSPDTEAQVRAAFPKQVGMLVVSQIIPGSAADGALEVGDILLRINGKLVTEFTALADAMDDAVGSKITVQVQRRGRVLDYPVRVDNLYSVSPDEYLEIGGAVLHNLSFQQARHMNMPVKGVYVANPGYMFSAAEVFRGSVITQVGDKPVANLDDFEKGIAALADGGRVAVRYFTAEEPSATPVRSVTVDRRWYPAQRCRRDDTLGYWPCHPLPAAPAAAPVVPAGASLPAPTAQESLDDPHARNLAPSLVSVSFSIPYPISGITGRSFTGTGLIVDAQRGLVVADRDTVPVAEGDARVTFGGTLEVPAKVVFVHPLHNLAVLSYDPRLIGTMPVRSAHLNIRPLATGERVWVVGLRHDMRLVAEESHVAAVEPIDLPIPRTPQFRESNLEIVRLVNSPGNNDGIIADASGDVRALWSTFAYDTGHELTEQTMGMPADVVAEMLEAIGRGGVLRSLEVELAAVPVSAALKLGLDRLWLQQAAIRGGTPREVLSVTRLVAGSPAARVLQGGDLLLAVDGQPVSRFRDVERATQKPHVQVTVWRNGAVVPLEVDTVALNGRDVDRFVLWAGATLQAPHRALAAQRGLKPEGVFVAYYLYGSPAARYGLAPLRRIVAVDGVPTPDLDSFLAAVATKANRAPVLLKTLTQNNAVEVVTLKVDNHYWPTYELKRTDSGWERIPHNAPQTELMARETGAAR
ncbi:MAG: trypsin-like peptidase domain-containing protein [Gammaproteobacteria bacterium]|nr:trypsin-like peptidase domain-containing protein [Gammaproteobacteria bacterium]